VHIETHTRRSPQESSGVNSTVAAGTSTYCFNPANGRINKHIDTWDSINNQQFFSMEAFLDVLRQMADFASTPEGLEQPQFRVIRCGVVVTAATCQGDACGNAERHATRLGDTCGNAWTVMLQVRVMHVEMHRQACYTSG